MKIVRYKGYRMGIIWANVLQEVQSQGFGTLGNSGAQFVSSCLLNNLLSHMCLSVWKSVCLCVIKLLNNLSEEIYFLYIFEYLVQA